MRILHNVNGEPEIGRAITWLAALAAIVSPILFQAYAMIVHAAGFDVTAWCLAYPGGLAALVTSGVLSIGRKDKDTEAARAVNEAAA